MQLELKDVDNVVERAVKATLKAGGLSRVYSRETIDSDGKDALSVTIVFQSEGDLPLTGDLALNTTVRVRHDLQRKGEERFPIIEFATEQELEHDDGTES